MKSKAQILAEEIDKIFEERGLKIKEVKRTGSFTYIPSNSNLFKKENKTHNQERR